MTLKIRPTWDATDKKTIKNKSIAWEDLIFCLTSIKWNEMSELSKKIIKIEEFIKYASFLLLTKYIIKLPLIFD